MKVWRDPRLWSSEWRRRAWSGVLFAKQSELNEAFQEEGQRTGWQLGDNLAHFLFEPNLEDAVGFVNDQAPHVGDVEAFGVFQVVKKTTGRSNEQIDALEQLLDFSLAVGTTHDNGECLGMACQQFASNTEDLQSQFSGGTDDDSPGTCRGNTY